MATFYRSEIDRLSDTFSDPEVVHRAAEIFGGLIDRIVIRHEETAGHTAEIEGKLLGLLSFADAKRPRPFRVRPVR